MTTLEKLDQISERIVTYIDKDFELYILEQALDLLEEVKRELGVAGELNSLQRDSERLEWLVENQCYPMPTKNGWCLTEEGCFCWSETSAKSWREAVDEAMEGEQCEN